MELRKKTVLVGLKLNQYIAWGGGYCLKEWTVFLRGVHTPMHTTGKVQGWWILRNGEILVIGGGDDLEMVGLKHPYDL